MLAGICTDCGSTFQNDNQFQLIMPLPCKMPDCKAAVVAGDWKGGSAVDRQLVIGPVRDGTVGKQQHNTLLLSLVIF